MLRDASKDGGSRGFDTWARRAGIWGRQAVARQGFDLGGGIGSLDECGDELVDQILVETSQRAQRRGVLGRFSLGAYVCVVAGQSPVDNLPSLPAQSSGPVLAPCQHPVSMKTSMSSISISPATSRCMGAGSAGGRPVPHPRYERLLVRTRGTGWTCREVRGLGRCPPAPHEAGGRLRGRLRQGDPAAQEPATAVEEVSEVKERRRDDTPGRLTFLLPEV